MKTIHFIGIKGVGMSAAALVAAGLGYQVTGSDTDEDFITDESLRGIPTYSGFSAKHITPSTDLVVLGAAYGEDNPELAEAKRRGIPYWFYSEFLGYLSKGKKTLAVSGTHGKTTTTAILAYLLYHTGKSPSYVIGTGSIVGLPSHGKAGTGEYFVVEADDYKRAPHDPTPKFLDLTPYAAVITSIEHDHPDLYPSFRDCLEAFYRFALRLPSKGFLVVCEDDFGVRKLRAKLADRRFISYGFAETAEYRIKLIRTKVGEPVKFRLVTASHQHGPFSLAISGQHNIANAAAAIVMALQLGVSEEAIVKLLPAFGGLERRYQVLGEVNGTVVIDDYAHHPTAVRLTLETAHRQFRYRPLWCVFQSHTYSRTKALLKEFGTAFTPADAVIVTDIFASAREQEATITAAELSKEIGKHHRNVMYVPKAKLLAFLKRNLPEGAVVITMGAGDIYKIGRQLVQESRSH